LSLLNTPSGYGALTKVLHWSIAGLFAFQYVAGHVMTRIGPDTVVAGASQGGLYNWHKSIGLVALLIAVVRIVNRRMGELPPWAETLSDGERRFIHRAEQVLYIAMVAMPVSGFLYVMAGGYGVHVFGEWHLPNPIGSWPLVAFVARWVHILAAWLLLGAIAGHVGLVLRHQFVLKDGLLARMLPRGRRGDGD
jgi:cytochrome b561